MIHHRCPAPGFTLIELMVAVALIGILAALAVDGLTGMTPKIRLNRAVNALRSDLEQAKMTAVKRNTVCLVAFNATSPGSYTACMDQDGDATCDPGEERILEQHFADYTNVTLHSAAFTGGSSISFNSRGQPRNFSNGTAQAVNRLGDIRSVSVSPTGEISIQ